MPMVITAILAPLLIVTSVAVDKDNDGLDDQWEARNVAYGCSAERADLIVAYYTPSGQVLSDLGVEQARCDRIFSRIGKNRDGSTGVRIKWIFGGNYTVKEAELGFGDFYKAKLTGDLRGKAHVLKLGAEKATGGQTDGYYPVSSCSYDGQTMAHELGHQLGLAHMPRGMESGQSPLYPSIMSYEFMTSFNGSTEAVHFSTGKFAGVSLDESRLSEVLPFPEAELSYLRHPPYQFTVRAAGTNVTHVDWNRNGSLGEMSVQANIDDGYGITPQDHKVIGKAAGKPTLLSSRRRLHILYPTLERSSSEASYNRSSPSPIDAGQVVVRSSSGSSYSSPITLMRSVVGDYTATLFSNHLYLATMVGTTVLVQKHADTDSFPLFSSKVIQWPELGSRQSLALVATNIDLWLVGWNSVSQRVFMRRLDSDSSSRDIEAGPSVPVKIGTRSTDPELRSDTAVGAGYNPHTARIVLFTTAREGAIEGRIKHNSLGRTSDDKWIVSDSRFVQGVGGGTATKSMPSVAFNVDPRNGLGIGFILAYRQQEEEPNQTVFHLSREVADRGAGDGWRKALFHNEWTETRSSPSVLVFENDLAVAYRWFGKDELARTNNDLIVHRKGSGIGNRIVADQDDVAHIRSAGLKERKGR